MYPGYVIVACRWRSVRSRTRERVFDVARDGRLYTLPHLRDRAHLDLSSKIGQNLSKRPGLLRSRWGTALATRPEV